MLPRDGGRGRRLASSQGVVERMSYGRNGSTLARVRAAAVALSFSRPARMTASQAMLSDAPPGSLRTPRPVAARWLTQGCASPDVERGSGRGHRLPTRRNPILIGSRRGRRHGLPSTVRDFGRGKTPANRRSHGRAASNRQHRRRAISPRVEAIRRCRRGRRGTSRPGEGASLPLSARSGSGSSSKISPTPGVAPLRPLAGGEVR